MTQDEWLKWYEQRTGTNDLKLYEDETVLFHPEHGFVSFFYHDEILEIHHMAGDGKFWVKVIKTIMKYHKLKTIRMFTKRNPKAWIRKYGGHIRGYYMEADINEVKD